MRCKSYFRCADNFVHIPFVPENYCFYVDEYFFTPFFFFFGNSNSSPLVNLSIVCCTDGHFIESHQLRWSGGKLWINYNIWYNHFNFLFEFTISAALQSVVVFDIRFIQHFVFAAADAECYFFLSRYFITFFAFDLFDVVSSESTEFYSDMAKSMLS